MEHAAKKRTSTALTKLMDLAPKSALLLTPRPPEPSPSSSSSSHPQYEEEMIPVELVQTGDLLKVVRGAQVPADGVVVTGTGFVDEALVTGESLPVTKRPGDLVVGGSVSTEGLFAMRVTGIGEDSTLRQIVRLMEEAQMAKVQSVVVLHAVLPAHCVDCIKKEPCEVHGGASHSVD